MLSSTVRSGGELVWQLKKGRIKGMYVATIGMYLWTAMNAISEREWALKLLLEEVERMSQYRTSPAAAPEAIYNTQEEASVRMQNN